jgi:hypothetical protein
MADVSLHDYKMMFARLLQRIDKPLRLQYAHQIAKQVVGKENAVKYTQFILQIGDEWPHDPEVIEEVDRLDAIPKTRERLLLETWSDATNPNIEPKHRIAAKRLYAELMRWTKNDEPSSPNKTLDTFQQMVDALKHPVET